MTVQQLIQFWLTANEKAIKSKTFYNYTRMLELHISPNIGDKIAHKITSLEVQEFINKLSESGNIKTGKGLSQNTIGIILSIIKSAYNAAIGTFGININPCERVKKPKGMVKKIYAFTQKEQMLIENLAITNKKYIGILLALYTGLRVGELLALTWADYNIKENILQITKTTYSIKSYSGTWIQEIGTPKSQSSIRDIPLPKDFKDILKKHKTTSKSQFIISCNSKQMSVRSYQSMFETMLKKLNIAKKGFHSLRHTFATRAIEAGVDIKTLSELLGHSSASITLNRYVHSNLEQKKKAMALLIKTKHFSL